MSDEILNKYLGNELHKPTPEDIKDDIFFKKYGLSYDIKNEEEKQEEISYKNYIKKELKSTPKEEVIKKLQSDYKKGKLSKKLYLSIIEEEFGREDAFRLKVSLEIEDISKEKNSNSEFEDRLTETKGKER